MNRGTRVMTGIKSLLFLALALPTTVFAGSQTVFTNSCGVFSGSSYLHPELFGAPPEDAVGAQAGAVTRSGPHASH